MSKKTLTSAFLFLCISGIFAKETSGLEIISFQLVNKLIVIKAEVDGAPGNFIFDTGAKNLLLNDRFFEGAETRDPLNSLSGRPVEAAGRFVQIGLGALPAQEIHATVINLEALETYTGLAIHGLIGLYLFRKNELMIDYTAQELRIYELDKNGERLFQNEPPQLYDQVHELDRKYHLPGFQASINGQKIRLALDTGASGNLISQVVYDKHPASFSVSQQKMLAGLGNQAKAAPAAIVNDIRVGANSFAPLEMFIYDFNYINSKLDGVPIDGILGYPFLSQFRISINLRKGKIYLWNNGAQEKQRYLAKGQGGG